MCELNLLKDVFIANDYPKKLVEKTLENFWKVELEKQLKALLHVQNEEKENEEQEGNKSGYYDVLHIPYVAGFSEKFAKDLKHVNVGMTFKKGKTISNSVCKL